MDITPATEKVDWSSEASETMKERYGDGPFKVTRISTRTRDNCSSGPHLHVTVLLSGNKPGTFCGKFFQAA